MYLLKVKTTPLLIRGFMFTRHGFCGDHGFIGSVLLRSSLDLSQCSFKAGNTQYTMKAPLVYVADSQARSWSCQSLISVHEPRGTNRSRNPWNAPTLT